MAKVSEQIAHAGLVGGAEIILHSHAGGGGASPAWYGKIAAAMNGGDPGSVLAHMQRAGNIAPTPTNISATVARCSAFMLPATLILNRIRWYGVGATTNIYQIAIYRYSDGARLTSQLAIITAVATWGSVAVSPAVTLSANVIYYIAVSPNATGTTAGIASVGTTIAAATGQINTAPQSLPGNLAFNAGFLDGYKFQFATTGGALPATAPTLVAQAVWIGGMPAFFLDNNSV